MKASPTPSRKGFVLLMALAVLAIIAVVLVSLARHSLAVAGTAADQISELQTRWGSVSLRKTLLDNATKTLIASDPARPAGQRRRREVQIELSLGGVRFAATVSDENAKLNLNAVERETENPNWTSLLRSLNVSLQYFRPRPFRRSAVASHLPAFGSWGQVFDFAEIRRADAAPRWMLDSTRRITCWGDGKVNVHSAGPEVLKSVVRLAKSRVDVQELIEIRDTQPEVEIDELLDQLRLTATERRKLLPWLTTTSSCFAVWVTIDSKATGSQGLSVRELDDTGPPRNSHFAW